MRSWESRWDLGGAPRNDAPGRRAVLRSLAGLSAVTVVGPARLLADAREERVLSFAHTHTGERLTVPYFADGEYLASGLTRLEHLQAGAIVREAAQRIDRWT